MSILDEVTNINKLLVQSRYFIVLLILVVAIKLFLHLKNKNLSHTPRGMINHKHTYIILVLSFIQILLVVPPISGKSSDSWYLMYVVNTMKTEGVSVMFQTDRPVVSYITYMIGEVLNVPGRISVPIMGIISALFYVASVFVFTSTLTENRSMGAISSMLAANTNGVRQFTLCFIWNLLGISFLMLFFSCVAIILRNESKEIYYWIFGVSILASCVFIHNFSVTVSMGILLLLTCLMISGRDILRTRKLVLLFSICSIVLYILAIIAPIYSAVVYEVSSQKLFFDKILSLGFVESLTYVWCSEYVWIFILSLIGIYSIAWGATVSEKIITAWVVGIIGVITIATGVDTGRIYLYLPLPILSVIGLDRLASSISNRTGYNKTRFINFVLIFLFGTSFIYFARTSQMNIRYVEQGPFPWDTQYIEQEHLTWIATNFDPREIVVVTDMIWYTPIPESNHPDLRGGFHYRLLSEIGNNLYVGRIADLLQEKPDYRIGPNPHSPIFHTIYLGFYSSLNVDWVLENKTILIANTIYNIEPLEEEILCESTKEGVYIVKDLTKREKEEWLRKWQKQ